LFATFTSSTASCSARRPAGNPTGGFTLGADRPSFRRKRSVASSARSSAGPSTACSAADLRHLRGALALRPIRTTRSLRSQPGDQVVASRSSPRLGWQNSQWLAATIVASLRALKGEDGPDLLVQGSSDLLQTLWKEGLVDELSVLIFPCARQGQAPVRPGSAPAGLKLVQVAILPDRP